MRRRGVSSERRRSSCSRFTYCYFLIIPLYSYFVWNTGNVINIYLIPHICISGPIAVLWYHVNICCDVIVTNFSPKAFEDSDWSCAFPLDIKKLIYLEVFGWDSQCYHCLEHKNLWVSNSYDKHILQRWHSETILFKEVFHPFAIKWVAVYPKALKF